MHKLKWPLALIVIFLASCSNSTKLSLSKVHLTNQKGFTETITNKERLKEFEDDKAIYQQPHKKLVRVFHKKGEAKKIITTYHPNGQIFQLLECSGNSAHGDYKEWHPNGILKINAFVVKGIPDIDISGQNTWFFEGKNEAFNEEGVRVACFNYINGSLEGNSFLYHPNGQLKQKTPYKNNLIHGTLEAYDHAGSLLERTNYETGAKTGTSYRYWRKNKVCSEEKFENGSLNSGVYFDTLGKVIGQVKGGRGQRVFFNDDQSFEKHDYIKGRLAGLIEVYDPQGYLKSSYSLKEGLKHGEETVYYDKSKQKQFSISWSQGKVHGTVKTWYFNGGMESQKEMSLNKKQGISTAWYEDGNLMLVEEYDSNLLKKGKYYERGSNAPISTLNNGTGIATLYDEKGIFIRKVEYQGGKPIE